MNIVRCLCPCVIDYLHESECTIPQGEVLYELSKTRDEVAVSHYFVIPSFITGVPMPPADEMTIDIQQGSSHSEVYTCIWLLLFIPYVGYALIVILTHSTGVSVCKRKATGWHSDHL